MSPGVLIAIQVVALYIFLGPLVLAFLYVLFDNLYQGKDDLQSGRKRVEDKDPALWTETDVTQYLKENRQ